MFPSEFKHDKALWDFFYENNLMMGRMIGGSKSGYRQLYPDNFVVFNANIVTKSRGKIWHGDLDVTRDEADLKNVSIKLGEDLYILREHDARWGAENLSSEELISRAVHCIKI